MADWLASLPLGGWLMLLFLVMAVPLVLFTTLLCVAFLPNGAGRAGWRDRLVIPGRAGTASWRELHPAWPAPPSTPRQSIGAVAAAPPAPRTTPQLVLQPVLVRAMADLQRVAAMLVGSALTPHG